MITSTFIKTKITWVPPRLPIRLTTKVRFVKAGQHHPHGDGFLV